jgi:lysozyme
MFAIDLSKWNGMVDFKKLKTNNPKVDTVIIRASQGTNNADPMFLTNVKGCIDNGFSWGAYHFATWNDSNELRDATAEAQFFIAQLKKAGTPTYTIWLDTESNKTNIILTKAQMGSYIRTFFAVLKNAGYQDYGIYASSGFVSSFYPSPNPFGNIKLWIASYNGKTKPTMPPGWTNYTLWQYTDQGRVAGVNTLCDLSKS